MCDYCGCPRIEPFSTLTIEHEVLRELVPAARAGDPTAPTDLRELWSEHLERERAALEPLAASLGLADVLAQPLETDAARSALVGEPSIDERVGRAVSDHADDWEFEVFPHLVMSAEEEDLRGAARRFGLAEESRA
jgi:hypothetical protein